jgi:hypothetical protein
LWTTTKIYAEINTDRQDIERTIDGMGKLILNENYQEWLINFMRENQTWPLPILILENLGGNVRSSLGQPYHLLEGHRRLAYLRSLYKASQKKMKSEHEIWLVKYKNTVF